MARNYYKLLAYKDEYEVARLYTDGTFLKRLSDQFEGDYKLDFHLAPPLLAELDPATGEPRKQAYGPWMLQAFQVLARLKRLRGTRLDPFGRTPERQMERQLIADYEKTLGELLSSLNHENHGLAVQIASIPDASGASARLRNAIWPTRGRRKRLCWKPSATRRRRPWRRSSQPSRITSSAPSGGRVRVTPSSVATAVPAESGVSTGV